MPFSEKTQRLRYLRNGFSESARNSELETIFKPFGLRHVIKSGSSHSRFTNFEDLVDFRSVRDIWIIRINM